MTKKGRHKLWPMKIGKSFGKRSNQEIFRGVQQIFRCSTVYSTV